MKRIKSFYRRLLVGFALPDLVKKELTFEQQQEISRIIENFKNNPSNSNKFRYELFAYIESIR